MKKSLLSLAALFVSSLALGQSYIQASDNTGFTYDCDENITTGIVWAQYLPTCDFSTENGGGGWDNSAVNELKYAWGQAAAGHVYDIMTFDTPLDLSNAANQHLTVTMRSTNGGTYLLKMEDASNTGLIDPITLNVTTTNQVFNVTLTPASGQSLAAVKKLYFYFENCPTQVLANDDIFISNFKAGSLLVTALTNSSAVASANLYPNPSNGQTTITADLNTVADVKVTLMDMYGKEVKVITQGTMSDINATFDVSDVAKGIYTVNYYVSGEPAKVQKLVVR